MSFTFFHQRWPKEESLAVCLLLLCWWWLDQLLQAFKKKLGGEVEWKGCFR